MMHLIDYPLFYASCRLARYHVKIGIFSFVIMLGLLSVAKAQNTTGMNFLEIAPNAASMGNSDIQSVMNPAPAAVFGNPAVLATLSDTTSIEINQTLWLAGSRISFGGVSYKRQQWTLSAAVFTNTIGDIEIRDRPEPSSDTFTARFTAIGFSAARAFKWLNIGASIAYLNEDLLFANASGYMINAGLLASLSNNRIRIGAHVENLGSMNTLVIQSSNLPTNIRTGISADIAQFTFPKGDNVPLLLTTNLEIVTPISERFISEDSQVSVPSPFILTGLSLLIDDIGILRLGYRTDDNIRSFSFGTGVFIDRFQFNYSLSPTETGFSPIHSIGLIYSF